jgi:hypothetical protein
MPSASAPMKPDMTRSAVMTWETPAGPSEPLRARRTVGDCLPTLTP